ncbi:hypothetical protein J4427_01435 [Candidatus Woesearchaeota archaeon]|nr:hypothetical protein [Candidatus Woesearchaeota archaeon]
MKNKRGQEGGAGIAVLILLIALFMILYILLLPPAQREEILNQSTKENNIIHDISPVNIFIKTEPSTKLLASSIEISKSLFSSKPKTLTFPIDDLSNLKSIILFFSVKDSKGNLEVWLNDHIIVDNKLDGAQTIDLPINYLKKNNVLEIKASNPGILFFIKNHYNLEDVGIKESYQIINSKEDRSFSIPEYEKNSLQKSTLRYNIYCNKLDTETDLRIYLNEKEVLSKLVTCIAGPEDVELSVADVKEGTNLLTFMIGNGDFQFSQIKIENELKEKSNPTYHFDVSEDKMDNIVSDISSVILRLNLDGTSKKADIVINNKQFSLDTSDDTFSKDISEYVNEGDNFIKIVPKNTFDIKLLEIRVE